MKTMRLPSCLLRAPLPQAALIAMLALATAGSARQALAQDTATASPAGPPKVGRVVGVFDAQTNQPVDGADVVDLIGGGSMKTQRAGLFGMGAFRSQNDSSVIRISKIGYTDTTLLVMVGVGDTVPMQVFLSRAASLPGVAVTAKEVSKVPGYLRDFDERVNSRQIGGAKIFAPGELRKTDGRRLFDMLRSKGIGTQTRLCRKIGLVRNGVPYSPIDIAPGSANVPDEFVDAYEAIIYYRVESVPMEFKKQTIGGDCGVLLLYGRQR